MDKTLRIRISPAWMERFADAHDFFLRKYFPHSDGPDLREFILLCAETACEDILEELQEYLCPTCGELVVGEEAAYHECS